MLGANANKLKKVNKFSVGDRKIKVEEMRKEMNNKLKPLQVLGIIDSEGMFFIAAYKRSDRDRYVYSLEFKVTQMHYSLELLHKLKEFFRCGRVVIDNKLTGGYKYVVTDLRDIVEKVIPFFDKYTLLTSKYLDYKVFREGILMIKAGSKGGVTEQVFNDINQLRAKSNKKRDIKEIYEFSKNHSTSDKITKDWLVGFIEGDGSFQFYMGKNIYASLEIAQSKARRPLLESIKEYLKAGAVKPKLNKGEELLSSRGTHRLVISGMDILRNRIIPMFEGLELYSIKGEDLKDWINLIEKVKSGDHNRKEGLKEMIRIKNGMNKGRPERNKSRRVKDSDGT